MNKITFDWRTLSQMNNSERKRRFVWRFFFILITSFFPVLIFLQPKIVLSILGIVLLIYVILKFFRQNEASFTKEDEEELTTVSGKKEGKWKGDEIDNAVSNKNVTKTKI